MNIRYDKFKDKFLYCITLIYFFLLVYLHSNKYIFSDSENIYAVTVGFGEEIDSLVCYNECGELIGFSIDFISNFLKKMFINVNYKKINKLKDRLFQYKIILHARRDDPRYDKFFFSEPLFESYRFIIISKKSVILSNINSYEMVGLKGNILYYFGKNKEKYEFVDSFDSFYSCLKDEKIMILERDIWDKFKKYIDYKNNDEKYKILEVTIPIEPVCIAIFYDSVFLLRSINHYIKKIMTKESYENSF